MSQIHGTVVSYNANTKVQKKGGGQYDAWELVYRDSENKIATLAKPVQGLRFNPALAGQLNALVPGDAFTVDREKKGEFWEIMSVTKGHSDGATSPAGNSSSGSYPAASPRSGTTPKSTYETPEERAKKQVIITRMAALNSAIATQAQLTKLDDDNLMVKAILITAREYEKYVYAGLGKVAGKYLNTDAVVPEKEAAGPDNGE